jgi:hypothetical protein
MVARDRVDLAIQLVCCPRPVNCAMRMPYQAWRFQRETQQASWGLTTRVTNGGAHRMTTRRAHAMVVNATLPQSTSSRYNCPASWL